MKSDEYFSKIVEKIQVLLKWDKNNGTLREDQYTFLTISRSVLLKMRNVSDKKIYIYRKNQHTLCTITFFFPANRAVYKIMWKTPKSRTGHR